MWCRWNVSTSAGFVLSTVMKQRYRFASRKVEKVKRKVEKKNNEQKKLLMVKRNPLILLDSSPSLSSPRDPTFSRTPIPISFVWGAREMTWIVDTRSGGDRQFARSGGWQMIQETNRVVVASAATSEICKVIKFNRSVSSAARSSSMVLQIWGIIVLNECDAARSWVRFHVCRTLSSLLRLWFVLRSFD